MQLLTKYFGTIECDPQEAISFPNGLFGFEEETLFYMLPFAGSQGNLLCFQSAKTPSLAFVSMDPFSVYPAYAPVLSQEELAYMGVSKSEDLCYYVFCRVCDPVKDSTLNLKCPIVINPDRRIAFQAILESKDYQMRHPLSEFGKKGEQAPC